MEPGSNCTSQHWMIERAQLARNYKALYMPLFYQPAAPSTDSKSPDINYQSLFFKLHIPHYVSSDDK
jgi:hypothetical protein